MKIITSAAYVTDELRSEFGQIPPAFLPLQNRRLFEHQQSYLNSIEGDVFLTIPKSYSISENDLKRCKDLNISLVCVPDGLTLADSIKYAIDYINQPLEELVLLHGDSLFFEFPREVDCVFVSKVKDNYRWGELPEAFLEGFVYTGFFRFSNQAKFKKSLIEEKSFLEAVAKYIESIKTEFYKVAEWFDFGHVNTYFRSRARLTTERAFNDLKINRFSVVKSSRKVEKIVAETEWFKNIPPKIKVYTPALIDSYYNGESASYEIEYLYLSTLNELFVFGENQPEIWEIIFDSCNEFLELLIATNSGLNIVSETSNFKANLVKKTTARLHEFENQTGISIDKPWIYNGIEVPSLKEISELSASFINDLARPSMVHGDFCFSNILFDFRKLALKVIDPRGLDFDDKISIFGDIRYDVAKLTHSVLGLYDFIIAGQYHLDFQKEARIINFNFYTTESLIKTQLNYQKRSFGGVKIQSPETNAIVLHLFLSMLPLHYDNENRQMALMANVYTFYLKYFK